MLDKRKMSSKGQPTARVSCLIRLARSSPFAARGGLGHLPRFPSPHPPLTPENRSEGTFPPAYPYATLRAAIPVNFDSIPYRPLYIYSPPNNACCEVRDFDSLSQLYQEYLRRGKPCTSNHAPRSSSSSYSLPSRV